jgi:hypothetical protein
MNGARAILYRGHSFHRSHASTPPLGQAHVFLSPVAIAHNQFAAFEVCVARQASAPTHGCRSIEMLRQLWRCFAAVDRTSRELDNATLTLAVPQGHRGELSFASRRRANTSVSAKDTTNRRFNSH